VKAALRRAAAADLAALEALEREGFGAHVPKEGMADELTRSWARVYVVDDAARGVVAYVTVWRVADEVEVIQVATRPDARREGHARALLARAFEEAQRDGAVRALLEVRPLNVSAVTLYRAMGFVELSRRARYYDDGEDVLVMELRLA
jgi:ribosomal protein S18 acetylase RimI-like enzyme